MGRPVFGPPIVLDSAVPCKTAMRPLPGVATPRCAGVSSLARHHLAEGALRVKNKPGETETPIAGE